MHHVGVHSNDLILTIISMASIITLTRSNSPSIHCQPFFWLSSNRNLFSSDADELVGFVDVSHAPKWDGSESNVGQGSLESSEAGRACANISTTYNQPNMTNDIDLYSILQWVTPSIARSRSLMVIGIDFDWKWITLISKWQIMECNLHEFHVDRNETVRQFETVRVRWRQNGNWQPWRSPLSVSWNGWP